MRAQEGFKHSALGATSSDPFVLVGGAYAMDAIATWSAGSITLQRLGPDGATYITAATALSADGTTGALALPPGTYKIAVVTATGVWVSISRIPGE